MKIYHKAEIQKLLSLQTVLDYIEEGFVMYSKKEAMVPHEAILMFEKPAGECHIKWGYAKRGKYYLIKVASGFFENPEKGLPSRNSLMLLFERETGMTVCVLLDEGYLTDLRSGAAGCVAAMYLAPRKVDCIGIIGTGNQAYFQLRMLQFATSCREAMIWGRDPSKAQKFCENRDLKSFHMHVAESIDQLASKCNLIVTTTSSSVPLLFASQIRKGTHITAVGADLPIKQELDPEIFAKADRVVVDSRVECAEIGDVAYALKAGVIKSEKMQELGEVILNPSLRRTSDDEITVVDLSGLAALDLQIAIAAYERLSNEVV
jgi:ornithine cyclodeaminase